MTPEQVTLKQQVAFMAKEVETRQRTYPVMVEMRRITKQEADQGIARAEAVLATLRKVLAAGGPAAEAGASPDDAEKERAPVATKPGPEVDLGIIVHEIHRCARDHADKCEHCAAIANILEESGSKV